MKALVEKLQKETRCSLMDCKKALDRHKGNYDKAKAWLLSRGHLKWCLV